MSSQNDMIGSPNLTSPKDATMNGTMNAMLYPQPIEESEAELTVPK